MKIQVTQEDIDQGISGDCGLCPIATAIKRQVKGRTEVFSGFCRIDGESVDLPPVVIQFIENFDYKLRCEPIEFDLEIPA